MPLRAGRFVVGLAVLELAMAAAATAAAAPSPSTAASKETPAPVAAAAGEIAPGVYLIAGKFVPGQQPDGNSIVFAAPQGAIVVDTGRHRAHTEAVLDRVAALGLELRAVINTHWHLDHVGGNVLVRQRHPAVRVYASNAIDEALGGFLADYRKQLTQLLASDRPTADAKEAFRRELALIDAGAQLEPNEVVASSGRRTIAGRQLELHLENRAVTAGDVWIYDPSTRVLVAGDLVTLPAPFLDTACPEGWQAALARLAAVEWDLLVPGHGALLRRQEFAGYRRAFDALLACAASSQPAGECVAGWFRDGGELVRASDTGNGRELVSYYVTQVLRGEPARITRLCGRSDASSG